MHNKIRIQRALIVLISSTLIASCATGGKHTLPIGDMTMAQIYRQETGMDFQENPSNKRNPALIRARKTIRQRQSRAYKASAYKFGHAATRRHTSKRHFRTLANPEVDIHVYPHMAHANGEAQPVPGYNTAFFMYKENHFAWPTDAIGQRERQAK